MESVHGVDVSWMSKHTSHTSNAKDNNSRPHTTRASTTPANEKSHSIEHNGNGHPAIEHEHTPPKAIPTRPNFSRSASSEKTVTLNGSLAKPGSVSPNTSRRNSWLSSISSKFGAHNAPVQATTPPASTTPPFSESPIPTGPQAPKNAILPHAAKAVGDAPYIPAPPKTGQPSFLQSALRRLSSSGGQLAPQTKGVHHGICERKVLNVDHHRERCRITDLDQSKLRRVAFCVDVEIASGPRYYDDDVEDEKRKERREKKKMEKGEGLALKQPEAIKEQKEAEGVVKATGEILPTPGKEVIETTNEVQDDAAGGEKDNTKKKEKKKRSEEERKARKEKKRKLAEANGTVPVELVRDGDSSGANTPNGAGTPKTQASPTTDPVRIYRRCCQLRETPVLKKITEQLTALSARTSSTGVVCRLDLTGYWLQLPDLITLGDYLAVVPVKELVMENCGLSDEGVRVILAGLLAAKCPDWERRKVHKGKWGEVPQGGVVERVVFKNNNKIGRDGWRYISTFLTMCRSLKSIDLSKVPFPQPVTPPHTPPAHGPGHLTRTNTSHSTAETASVLGRAIGERLGGREFELLNMAECGLTTEQLGNLVDGVIKSGLRRLGIAGNNISSDGMHHVARFIREGKCEGLDLGGNDLKDQLGVIADALDQNNQLYALSLADCNLTPDSLWALFPALAKLKNFRFIDLSQNHGLFDSEPSALSLLRRYLPKLPTLKRIHLTDVSMTSEQAIALAEILPESPNLAHVNIMENPGLAVLADAKDEANQEEACALYASLMAAVRVSKTIICIDIEVPSPESSEIVKALAKQVVAYCLWNMERGPVAEISEAAAAISDPHGGEKEVAVPDVLLHLVGHVEGFHENHDDDEPAPDDDYVIGGTGVVKALSICLRNRGNDSRRPSADRPFSSLSQGGRGSETPTTPVSGGKAKDMSKNLLGSARKIRARLQPALVKEARSADRNNYQRLLFLDQTLEGMIKRFEDEFPETRLPTTVTSPPLPDMNQASPSESIELNLGGDEQGSLSDTEPTPFEAPMSDAEDEDHIRPMLSRHNSDVSLASRALSQEEGRMHRFGQQFRRDILKQDLEDHEHGMTGREEQPRHLQLLRAMVDGLGGEEIKNKINSQGHEAVMEELNNEASLLRIQLMEQDPEGWEKFRESQEAAMRNSRLAGLERNVSAIE